MTKDNQLLSSFKVLFFIFVLIAIIAAVIALVMWKKSKKLASKDASHSSSRSDELLAERNRQLVKSENLAALGYIATDTTYAVGISLDDLQTKLESSGDTQNAALLKPVVTLLTNINLIAADQDETKVQSFDLISYIQRMIILYDFEFTQSDVEYLYSGEKALTIKSVPSYIALVLLNIINNSLKHGFNNNGKGKIALMIEKGAKGGATITYSDDGKGMNQETLAQIFEPFFTTHSDRGYVGLGMSITHDLITNKLAGTIKINSQEGKGTTVTINLP
jgi:signal transduction histidine kinase